MVFGLGCHLCAIQPSEDDSVFTDLFKVCWTEPLSVIGQTPRKTRNKISSRSTKGIRLHGLVGMASLLWR